MTMARRHNRIAVLDMILLVPASAAALVSAAVLGPVALLAVWLCREVAALKAMRIERVERLLPTPDERASLAQYRDLAARLRSARTRTMRMGMNEGLTRRPDGLFNDTVPRAQELNQLLATIMAEQNQVALSLSALVDRIEARIDRWVSARSATFGARTAIIACMVTMLALIQSQPDWLGAMGTGLVRLGVPLDAALVPLLGAGVCATLVGFAIGFLTRLTRRDTLWAGVPAI
jgi:hypothetical protein